MSKNKKLVGSGLDNYVFLLRGNNPEWKVYKYDGGYYDPIHSCLFNSYSPHNMCTTNECETSAKQTFSCSNGVLTPHSGQDGYLCDSDEKRNDIPYIINVNNDGGNLSYTCSHSSPPAPPSTPPSKYCLSNPNYNLNECNISGRFPDPQKDSFFYKSILPNAEFKISNQGPTDTCNKPSNVSPFYSGTVIWQNEGDPEYFWQYYNNPQIEKLLKPDGSGLTAPIQSSATYPKCGNNTITNKFLHGVSAGKISPSVNYDNGLDAIWASLAGDFANIQNKFKFTLKTFDNHNYWEISVVGQEEFILKWWPSADNNGMHQCYFTRGSSPKPPSGHGSSAFCFHNHGSNIIYLQALKFDNIDNVKAPQGTCNANMNPPSLGFYCDTGLPLTWGFVDKWNNDTGGDIKLAGVFVGHPKNNMRFPRGYPTPNFPTEEDSTKYYYTMYYCCSKED